MKHEDLNYLKLLMSSTPEERDELFQTDEEIAYAMRLLDEYQANMAVAAELMANPPVRNLKQARAVLDYIKNLA